jgi:hypothetical protein
MKLQRSMAVLRFNINIVGVAYSHQKETPTEMSGGSAVEA